MPEQVGLLLVECSWQTSQQLTLDHLRLTWTVRLRHRAVTFPLFLLLTSRRSFLAVNFAAVNFLNLLTSSIRLRPCC